MLGIGIATAAGNIAQAGPEATHGVVGIDGEHLTGTEMADAFSRLLGRTVRYNAVTPEVYRGFDFPGADDLGNMFQFKRNFDEQYCGLRDVTESRRLNPDLMTFSHWLEAHRDAFTGS